MPNYCANCGAKLKDGARFCTSCGEAAILPGSGYMSHYEINVPPPVTPPHTSFSCMLAYIPGLFWLPLLSNRKDKVHRECANQGLLLTILSVLFGAAVMQIIHYLYQNGAFEFSQIIGLFENFTMTNWLPRLPKILGWMGLTALTMYVPVNCICGFFHGMAFDQPYRISFFGRLELIRTK